MATDTARHLPWDWYDGVIPDNVVLDEAAFVETSYSFHRYRSQVTPGVRIGRGASAYLGTMFEVGPAGRVTVGDYALINGARIICNDRIDIGDYALISWNVLLMDSYGLPMDPRERRRLLHQMASWGSHAVEPRESTRPISIGRNVWIGFDVCVLPGVTVGPGAVIGARSVVVEDVPAYSVAAGNPARIIRRLEAEE